MKNYIPYGHQWIDDGDIEAVIKVLKSDWITQGPKIKEFEEKIASYCGAKYAVAVSSGTAALHIASLSCGIKKGDEAITTPITFVASANCVLYCGGKPIFADIQPDTINIDPEKIKNKITKKTKAIIPVDFAGHPCDLKEIYNLAQENNLTVIEDASHALGAEYRGTKIGSCKYSDMTVFSFHPVKIITTGEGGIVTTNNKEYYEKLLLFRNHGITKDSSKFSNGRACSAGEKWYYEMQELGYNYRITDFQCALGVSQLKKIDKFIQKRREIVQRYNEAFKDIEEVVTPTERPEVKSAWHLYVIRIKKINRRKIFESLRQENIGVQVHYIPVYYQPYYQKFGYKKGLCPKAEEYYKEAISLPLFPRMTDKEIDRVVERSSNNVVMVCHCERQRSNLISLSTKGLLRRFHSSQ